METSEETQWWINVEETKGGLHCWFLNTNKKEGNEILKYFKLKVSEPLSKVKQW